jgi:hypothetical protein
MRNLNWEITVEAPARWVRPKTMMMRPKKTSATLPGRADEAKAAAAGAGRAGRGKRRMRRLW